MPKAPNEAQMETLLNTVGFIGAQTGFPAINLTVTDDGSTIQGKDADIMIVGGIPDKLKDDKQIDLLVQATESWVKTPMRQTRSPALYRMRRSRGRNSINADLFRCDGGGDWLPVAV